MTDLYDRGRAAPYGHATSLTQLAGLASPQRPAGSVGALLNRMLVYARPNQVPALLPYVSLDRGGFILAGAKAGDRMGSLRDSGYEGMVLVDPAAYEKHKATVEAPFWSPEDQLLPPSLEEMLDQQRTAGAPIALTATKYIVAGDTDSLKSAGRQARRLRRDDVIFVAPLDIALLDRQFIRQTTAILADVGHPIALVLGKQFDPLGQAAERIIPNLRQLAATVQLMPIRTDFNAFDLVAHGAFAGAIGTGGSIRHAVEPPQPSMAFSPGPSPSVLVPELMCWWKGDKLAQLYGARPGQAPRCPCLVCYERRLTRFRQRDDQNEAMAHAVAVWSQYAADMLDAPTLRLRAEYWRNVCRGALDHHRIMAVQLQQAEPIKPQKPLEVWAGLPLWPSDQA